MQFKVPHLVFVLFAFSSCTFYKYQTLTAPVQTSNQTRAYLHTPSQVYALSNLSLSEKALSFRMDSVKLPVSGTYREYKANGGSMNEVHLRISEWNLKNGRSKVDDTLYATINPSVLNRVQFFTPSDFLTMYPYDVQKIMRKLKVIVKKNGNFYYLQNPVISKDEISGTMIPGPADLSQFQKNPEAGLLVMTVDNVNTTGAVYFPLSSVSAIDYRFVDVKQTFTANAAISAVATSVFLLTLFTTTEVAESGR